MRPGEQEYADRYEDRMKDEAFGTVRECGGCDGLGWYIRDDRGPRSDDWHSYEVECATCEGTGRVER